MIALCLCFYFSFHCLSPAAFSTQQYKAKKELVIGWYNVENLFDTIDDPKIDDNEFLPDSELGWNSLRYQKKLANLAEVISQLGSDNGPDLLGMCEVENIRVLRDLVKQDKIKKRHYEIIHFDCADKRGIDVACLYDPKKFKIKTAKLYPIDDPEVDSFPTREILYIEAEAEKQTLHLLFNHWPSRRNPEANRLKASKKARAVVDSLLTIDSLAPILLMGDFNDEPFNKSITEILQADSLIQAPNQLYNAMATLKNNKIEGSIRFKNGWNLIDQFIFSQGILAPKNNKAWKYVPNSAQVFNPPFIRESAGKYKGNPLRTFVGKRYMGGYSDHFPIYMRLVKNS
jgi:hypothetical protein